MPDRFGRPSRKELRSSFLLRLAAFIPVEEHFKEDGTPTRALSKSARLAINSGATLENVAEVLQVPAELVGEILLHH